MICFLAGASTLMHTRYNKSAQSCSLHKYQADILLGSITYLAIGYAVKPANWSGVIRTNQM